MATPSLDKNLFEQARDSLALFQAELRTHDPETEDLDRTDFPVPYEGEPSTGMKCAIATVLTYVFRGVAAALPDRDLAITRIWVSKRNHPLLLDTALAARIGELQEMLKTGWQSATDPQRGNAWKRTFPRGTPEHEAYKILDGILIGLSIDWSSRAALGEGAGIYPGAYWDGDEEPGGKQGESYAMITGPQDLQGEILAQFGVMKPKI